MDLEKLKRIIDSGDAKDIHEFFRELRPEKVTELTLGEYEKVMDLCEVLRNKKTDKEEILNYFYDSGYRAGDDLIKGLNIQKNALISRFYFDCFLKLKETEDMKYADAQKYKANSLRNLEAPSENTKKNLHEAIACDDKAANIYQIENAELCYAGTQLDRGISLSILADLEEDTEKNLHEAIACYDKAANIYQREKAEIGYARTQANKGANLSILAEQGVDPENNLKAAIRCYSKAEAIYKGENFFLSFIEVSLNHCLTLWWWFTETTDRENREDAIKVLESAKNVAKNAFREGESHRIIHPTKKELFDLLMEIDDALSNEKNAESKEALKRERKKVSDLVPILLELKEDMNRGFNVLGKKVDNVQECLDRLENKIEDFISDLEENGVKIRKEDKIDLKGWVDALKRADDSHFKAFMGALRSLPENNEEKEKFLSKAKKKDRPMLEKFWEKFCHITKEMGKEVGKSVAADSVKENIPILIPHIQQIMVLVLGFSISHPVVVALIILPFLSSYFKKLKN